MPFSLRFPLAFDGALLGQVVRIFTDTVARWYRQRQADRGLPGGQCGSVTASHRASSDLRCDPHFHCLFLDGVYALDGDGKGQMFHPAPAGRAGKCSAYAAGSDPQNECVFGLGACHAACNGAGYCDFPKAGTLCGTNCRVCDGDGMCVVVDAGAGQ
jgi:hypothetical protein